MGFIHLHKNVNTLETDDETLIHLHTDDIK